MISNMMLSSFGVLDTFTSSFVNVFKSFKFPSDLIDIVVVAYIIYHAIRLVRETRAMQLVKGIVAIFVVYFVADLLNMITLRFFINIILQTGILVLVILFQPELRSAMEKMGRTGIPLLRFPGQVSDEQERHIVEELIDTLTESCLYLSSRKTGALVVIERMTKLGDVIGTGTVIDSAPSTELIGNIFFTNSPLHDGALIIREGRLYAAGCYLPLSQNLGISKDLGTRHRAALGMSEVSDAVILVVSEETGAITVAHNSTLQRRLSEKELRRILTAELLPAPKEEKGKKLSFWRGKE